jgi:hypothetical protein
MIHDYFLHAVDPGGDSGLSLLHVQPEEFKLLDYSTIPYEAPKEAPPTQQLIEWTLDYPGKHILVYEDFHIRNTPEAASTDTTALRVIGGIEQMLYDRSIFHEVVTQLPGEAKHTVADEHLEALGLHLGHQHHQRHVRDSLRHAVTLLFKRHYLPVLRAAYPKGGLPVSPRR